MTGAYLDTGLSGLTQPVAHICCMFKGMDGMGKGILRAMGPSGLLPFTIVIVAFRNYDDVDADFGHP